MNTSRNQLSFYTNHRVDNSDQIFVFFTEEKSVGVKAMRKCEYLSIEVLSADAGHSRLLSILDEKSIQRGIIVFPGNMTPAGRKVLIVYCLP